MGKYLFLTSFRQDVLRFHVDDIWTNSMTTMGYNSATPLKRYAQRVDFPSKPHHYGRVLMWKQGCGLLGSLTPNLRQEPLRHFVGVRRKKKAFCPRNHRLRANIRFCAHSYYVVQQIWSYPHDIQQKRDVTNWAWLKIMVPMTHRNDHV